MSKKSGKRPCPPNGGTITSAECGADRNRRFACPGDCPFNPFAPANYDRLLEVEEKFDGVSIGWLKATAPQPETMVRELARASATGDPAVLHSFVAVRLFHERDGAGLSVGDRLLQAPDSGLNNDQQALLRAKCTMRVALLEVHRVLDQERVEAVDLFAPEAGRFLILDRSLARVVVRYSTLLGWRYALPHFHRFCGAAIMVPDLAELEPAAVVREIARHLGGAESEPDLPGWLARNFARVQTSLSATHAVRRHDMLAAVDARFGKAVYELQKPLARCRSHLEKASDVAPGDLADEESEEGFLDTFDWLEAPAEGKPANRILGRVLIGPTHWRLEGNGGERFARLRTVFEAHMGERVKFTGERFDDLAAQLSRPVPAEQLALVPPRLREYPTRIELSTTRIPISDKTPAQLTADARQDFLRAYPDTAVPALGGLTPRQAAADPGRRPDLLRLLKAQVRSFDEENLRLGTTGDINWLLHELGAGELIQPPPPLRPPTAGPGQPSPVDDALDDLADSFPEPPTAELDRPAAPPLPDRPFTPDEVEARIAGTMDRFVTAQEALDELARSGSTLLDDLSAAVAGDLDENEFSFLIPMVLPAWFAFVPIGSAAPELSLERLHAAYEREVARVDKMIASGSRRAMNALLSSRAQPALALALTAQLLESANTAPEDIRPVPEAVPCLLAALLTVIDEVDYTLRHRAA